MSDISVISVQDAGVFAGGYEIFADVNIEVKEGSCHGLVGADNEGKTSLIWTMLGYNRLSCGSISVFDEAVTGYSASRMERVGYLPDELLCFADMTGKQYLKMVLKLKGMTGREEEAEKLLDYFEVDASLLLTDMPDDMNKCMYIVSALMTGPELLVLDEPFNFLNEKSIDRLKKWLKEYVASGKSVFIVSDSYDRIKDICDTISVMRDRTTVWQGIKPEDIRSYKLVTATGVNVRTIPECMQVVCQDMKQCRMCCTLKGRELADALLQLECSDFTVEDITLDDVLFCTYDWVEELF